MKKIIAFVYDDYIKVFLTFDDKPIDIPTTEEIENMANSSDIASSASPKKHDAERRAFIFIQAAGLVYHHASACISSPKAYIITRSVYFCALMIYNSFGIDDIPLCGG